MAVDGAPGEPSAEIALRASLCDLKLSELLRHEDLRDGYAHGRLAAIIDGDDAAGDLIELIIQKASDS